MKKIIITLIALCLSLTLIACSSNENENEETVTTYKIGICNYVDDASLNQIYENIVTQLEALETDEIKFEILYENMNGDSNVGNQIISNFIYEEVDLMIPIATPVAMLMQAATEDNQIPVVFAAVSDPVGVGLIDSLESPGGNITGTSDYLDTNAVMNLIFALNPEITEIGLLYDIGQDSSTTAISTAKEYLDSINVSYNEATGTTVDEIKLAVQSLISDGITVIFTPSDNTVMTAELSIYEMMAEAGIQHYAGADSFALNGAFCGYGVDYANLGVETANMAYEILVNGADISSTAVKTFDNGIATINSEICTELGLNYDDVVEAFTPYCSSIQSIQTAESF